MQPSILILNCFYLFSADFFDTVIHKTRDCDSSQNNFQQLATHEWSIDLNLIIWIIDRIIIDQIIYRPNDMQKVYLETIRSVFQQIGLAIKKLGNTMRKLKIIYNALLKKGTF